jgi:hypothetical protein
MGDEDTAVERSTSGIGAAIFVSWSLFLGPVGLVVLLGVAYAMVVQNLALGIIGGLLLATPVVLSAAWIPVAFFALLREKRAPSTALNSESALETVSAD